MSRDKQGELITVTGPVFGDEGKAKIVDWLAWNNPTVAAVARYQGGDNAGHTVVVGRQEYRFHYVPSGILAAQQKKLMCVLGRGMVVSLPRLFAEIQQLAQLGVEVNPSNLLISQGIHLTLPYHMALERARESGGARKDTTKKAISQTYGFAHLYQGVRAGDIVGDVRRVSQLIDEPLAWANAILTEVYGELRISKQEVMSEIEDHRRRLSPFLHNEIKFLNTCLDKGSSVICEGAQGGMLDVDLGIYPYTTASNTWPAAIQHGCGLDPRRITRQIYVVKAYLTRVGQGPLVSEIPDDDERGKIIRERGHEYGTTTGRPRRVGWFDQIIGRFGRAISPPTELAITKADVLSGLDLRVCVDYKMGGVILSIFPTSMITLQACQPIYQDFTGWDEDITGASCWDDLPSQCQNYLKKAPSCYGAPITMVGTGPERNQIILV